MEIVFGSHMQLIREQRNFVLFHIYWMNIHWPSNLRKSLVTVLMLPFQSEILKVTDVSFRDVIISMD